MNKNELEELFKDLEVSFTSYNSIVFVFTDETNKTKLYKFIRRKE